MDGSNKQHAFQQSPLDSGVDDWSSAEPQASRRQRHTARVICAAVIFVVIGAAIGITVFITARRSPTLRVPAALSGSFTTWVGPARRDEYKGRLHKWVGPDGRTLVSLVADYTDPETRLHMRTTLWDGRGYIEAFNDTVSDTQPAFVWCYNNASFPPVGDVEELARRAVLAPGGSLDAGRPGAALCDGVDVWAVNWGVQHYALCLPDPHTLVVMGPTFHTVLALDAEATPLTLAVPVRPDTGIPAACPMLSPQSALNIPVPVPDARRRLSSANKPCVFVAASFTADGLAYAASEEYWTQSTRDFYLPTMLEGVCSKVTFLGYDMSDPGSLSNTARQWCTDMLETCGVTDGTKVPKSRLFTHGAASLLVARALAIEDACSLKNAAKWFSVGASTGTLLLDAVVATQVCTTANDDPQSAQYSVATSMSFCDGDAVAAGFGYMANDNDALLTAMREGVHGALCGDSMQGMDVGTAIYLQQVVDFNVENDYSTSSDSVVLTQDCKKVNTGGWTDADASNADKPWKKKYLYAPLNHFDITCRNGNQNVDPGGLMQPCTWYVSMAG